jgi:hypothetical protein
MLGNKSTHRRVKEILDEEVLKLFWLCTLSFELINHV